MTIVPSIGIIVGRFQVPELHDGHLELFRAVKARHQRVAIFIGLSPTKNATPRHPLDFETRARMIQAKFPEFTVLPLPDKRTDEEWSKNLDTAIWNLIGSITVPTLYGSRDSFTPHYHGEFKVKELELLNKCSGTAIRESLTNTVKESFDFRAGIIYNQQNRRPLLYTAVDIAIWNTDRLPGHPVRPMVLLARKPGFPLWRFPGGYCEANGSDFESEAKREVMEETGLDISSVEYIANETINDWRYHNDVDQIRSILYAGKTMTYGGKANDDICEVKWFPAWQIDPATELVPEHRSFYLKFLNFLDTKGYPKCV